MTTVTAMVAAPLTCQSHRTRIVIHYDPELVALDSELLQSAAGCKVEQSASPQPPGVFVGSVVTPIKSLKQIVAKVLDRLKDALDERLYREPLEHLQQQIERTKKEVAVMSDRVVQWRRKQDPLAPRRLATAEKALANVTAEMAAVEMEIRTDEPMLRVLQKELAKANTELVALSSEASDAELRLERLMAGAGGVQNFDEKARDDWHRRFAELSRRREALRTEVEILNGSVAHLSSETSATTIRLYRARFRLEALKHRQKEVHAALENAGRIEEERRELESRMTSDMEALVRLRDRLAELEARHRAVRPVRIRRW